MKNNKENRLEIEEKITRIIAVENVKGIMGASGMYLDDEMEEMFRQIINGEKTTEECIQELNKKYKRPK